MRPLRGLANFPLYPINGADLAAGGTKATDKIYDTYIYIYVCVNLYTYICLHIIYIYICVCICRYIYVCIHIKGFRQGEETNGLPFISQK